MPIWEADRGRSQGRNCTLCAKLRIRGLTDASFSWTTLSTRGSATAQLTESERNVKIWTSKPLICALAATFVSVGSAAAADGANKDDAVAMVKKAVAFIKEQGPEKSYPEVSNKAGKFIDRDLYVVVYQLDGKVLAHGSNEKFVGKDMSDPQDVDGKLFVKERVELAAKHGSFWQDYKFVNP